MPDDSAAVGHGDYLVQEGDCMQTIAHAHGYSWQSLWDHPANAELKETRGDPKTLVAGDRVMIPPLRKKSVKVAIDELHRFKVETIPLYLDLRLLNDEDEPRADEPYVIEFSNGEVREGTLDGDGRLKEIIDPRWTHATLYVGHEDDEPEEEDDEDDDVDEDDDYYDVIELVLGGMDPLETISGVQGRLSALGFAPGKIDGIAGPFTEAAVRRFQEDHDLVVDGIIGPKTRGKLAEIYDEA